MIDRRVFESPHGPESEVILFDYDADDVQAYREAGNEEEFDGTALRIHPWNRPGFGIHERSVFVEVKAVDVDSVPVPDPNNPGMNYGWAGIFDRDEFLDAVVLAFPGEVTRLE